MQEKLSLKSDPALITIVYLQLVVAAIVSVPQSYFSYDTPKYVGLNLGVLSLCILYLYRNTFSKERYVTSTGSTPSGARLIVLLLLLAAAASTLFSELPFESLVGISGNYGGSITLFLYLSLASFVGLLSARDTRHDILTAITTTAAAVSLVAILEFFILDPGQAADFGAGNSNYLALFLALAYPIALVKFLEKGLKNTLITFSLPMIALAQLLTFSRAGMLGILVSTILIEITYPRKAKKLPASFKNRLIIVCTALFLIFIFYLTLALGQKNLERFSEVVSFEGTTATRIILYEGAVKMISEHPLAGTGPDLFAYYFPKYHSQRLVSLESKDKVGRDILYFDPHNYLLDKVSGIGILGMVFLLWLLIFAMMKTYTHRIDTNNLAIFSGITGFLVVSMFIPGRLNTDIVLWMLIGLAVFSNTEQEGSSVKKSKNTRKPTAEKKRPLWLIAAAIVLFLIICSSFLSLRIAQADHYFGKSFTGIYEADLDNVKKARDIAQNNIILWRLSSIYLIHEAEVELRNIGQAGNNTDISVNRSSMEKLSKLPIERNSIDPYNYYYTAKIDIYLSEFISPFYLAEAEKKIDAGLKLFPNYPDLLSLKGKLFFLKGENQKAVETYERLIDLGYDKPEARYFYLKSTNKLGVEPKHNVSISDLELRKIDEDLPIPLIMSEQKVPE